MNCSSYNDIWMLQTKTSHFWKVSYAIILLGRWCDRYNRSYNIIPLCCKVWIWQVCYQYCHLLEKINNIKYHGFWSLPVVPSEHTTFRQPARIMSHKSSVWSVLVSEVCLRIVLVGLHLCHNQGLSQDFKTARPTQRWFQNDPSNLFWELVFTPIANLEVTRCSAKKGIQYNGSALHRR